MSETVKALVVSTEWNWDAALDILTDNWFDMTGARVVTLTEEPAYEFYEMFVKTPKRVFIEWEGVQE